MADALDLIKSRLKVVHTQALDLAASITSEQLAWRPAPRAHSIAWTLWHMARSADRLSVELAGPKPGKTEVWVTDGLAKRWGLGPEVVGTNGVGTAVSDDVAARLAPPSQDELVDYARRAFASEEASADALDAAALDREYDSAILEGRRTVGASLMVCLTHENRHLGELEYIKGLLGLKGTATR